MKQNDDVAVNSGVLLVSTAI